MLPGVTRCTRSRFGKPGVLVEHQRQSDDCAQQALRDCSTTDIDNARQLERRAALIFRGEMLGSEDKPVLANFSTHDSIQINSRVRSMANANDYSYAQGA